MRRARFGITVSAIALAALALTMTACSGGGGGGGGGAIMIAGGLPSQEFMTITAVDIDDQNRMVVTFTLIDGSGPLTFGDVDADPRFHHAYVVVDPGSGRTRYQSYILSTQTGQSYQQNGMTVMPALPSATQVNRDTGGSFEDLGGGTYRYTFGNAMPAGIDMDTTHTIAAYTTRGGRTIVANPYVYFVPSNLPLVHVRESVATSACADCHGDLGAHGGTRNEVVLCQVCHTDQTIDPETGSNVEFSQMVHKIHYGANLTNGFTVVGFGGSIHDYSEVHFPRDVRNCTACHKDASQSDHWTNQPSRAACGSCHDDVDFPTGTNHGPGVMQTSDDGCTICHASTAAAEFDQSVPGAHVVPYESLSNPGLTLAITDVTNMTPGTQPSVTFTISNNSGPVDITTLNRVAVVFGGPTADYTQLISTDHRFNIQGGGSTGMLTTHAVGNYTYVPFRDAANTDAYTIPMMASGTWAVGMESRTENIAAGPDMIRFGANNPVVYVDLGSGNLGAGSPMARRVVVTDQNCDSCHGDLRIHGNLRTEIAYCVLCHNRWGTDEDRRGGASDPKGPLDPITNPPETIDFGTMVHKIHRGAELDNGYTVWGFGSAIDFGAIHFPHDLRNCNLCHANDSYELPVPATNSPTVYNIAGTPLGTTADILPPVSAVCTSCHDGNATLGHVLTNITPSPVTDPSLWFEGCDVCHGPGAPFDVEEAHDH